MTTSTAPTIGRQVNYCMPPAEGSDAWVTKTATITDVDPDGSGSVGLTVFTGSTETPVEYIAHVPQGDGTFKPNTWNWPTIA